MSAADIAPRSLLFVPGDSERKLARAPEAGADALIYDLEDSVAPDRKEAARALVAGVLADRGPAGACVRVNALSTGLLPGDLDALAAKPPALVMLPKCEGPQDIAAAAQAMSDRGMGTSRLLPLATETARGLRMLLRADWTHPRLAGLTWGAEDLSADLGALANREPDGSFGGVFALARDLCLLAAREAGVWAIDTVFTDTRDGQGCEAEARHAFLAGFDGKMAIHPAQVERIHAGFRPDEARLDEARRIVAAMQAAGTGVAVLDGRMIDRPHLRAAERLLALAQR